MGRDRRSIRGRSLVGDIKTFIRSEPGDIRTFIRSEETVPGRTGGVAGQWDPLGDPVHCNPTMLITSLVTS